MTDYGRLAGLWGAQSSCRGGSSFCSDRVAAPLLAASAAGQC
jgi:hypothetical protein